MRACGMGVPLIFGAGGGKIASNSSREMVSTSNRRWATASSISRYLTRICPGLIVGFANQFAHFFIDLFGNCFRIIALLGDLAAQEDQFFFLSIDHRSQLVAHPQAGNHGARHWVTRSRSLEAPEVISSKTISSAARPPSKPTISAQQFLARHQGAVFFRKAQWYNHQPCRAR